MPIVDWWAELDWHIAVNKRVAGKSGGIGKSGGFSEAEWERARREHREKMNGRT
jgi:hypothetical protein